MQFTVKKIKNNFKADELLNIGFDKSYIQSGIKKHRFVSLKIENLPFYCATIIKEAALSIGADAGIHRDVLTRKVENSDIILSGTVKQLENIAQNLLKQPFGLKNVAEKINLILQEKEYHPQIMGILNITDNSFSDGGKYLDLEAALNHTKEMINFGADIIDIGAEATNPKAEPIEPDVEIQRLKPIIKEVKKLGAIVSIDTRNAKTAEFAVKEGADIINDISGLQYDSNMLSVIKNSNAEIVVMHSKGTPKTMDLMCEYNNLTKEIYDYLNEKIILLEENGVNKNRITVDVGFGFAKNIEQNFELLEKIEEFNSLGVKTLAGVSRKRFLCSLIKDDSQKDLITSLSSFYLFENKVDIVRVHDVKSTKLALDFYNSIY